MVDDGRNMNKNTTTKQNNENKKCGQQSKPGPDRQGVWISFNSVKKRGTKKSSIFTEALHFTGQCQLTKPPSPPLFLVHRPAHLIVTQHNTTQFNKRDLEKVKHGGMMDNQVAQHAIAPHPLC